MRLSCRWRPVALRLVTFRSFILVASSLRYFGLDDTLGRFDSTLFAFCAAVRDTVWLTSSGVRA